MSFVLAKSRLAQEALEIVTNTQDQFVEILSQFPSDGVSPAFEAKEWRRERGRSGGGLRFVAADATFFNRASVNVSQVHYEEDNQRSLSSTTALSTIIHPRAPRLPSFHMHVSWTQFKSGQSYWRLMADLNPSIPCEQDTIAFKIALKAAVGRHYGDGIVQGERYFRIPSLNRTRGTAHFYLEEFNSGDTCGDQELAFRFGRDMSEAYEGILREHLIAQLDHSEQDWEQQLAYHTLYFLQVLTLDRGTVAGLLVHDENDLGILGSLPSHIDRSLLKSWVPNLPELHQILVSRLLEIFPLGGVCLVHDTEKLKIAEVIRSFYSHYPLADLLLARGVIVPHTVENHKSLSRPGVG